MRKEAAEKNHHIPAINTPLVSLVASLKGLSVSTIVTRAGGEESKVKE